MARSKANNDDAIECNGATVPAGTRVYAVGDTHGCAEQLRSLHEDILRDSDEADKTGTKAKRRVIVYLGDYVDRGPDSRDLLDLLIEEPLPDFESVHLMGNHDSFMLRFLESGEDFSLWLMNGGDATLTSYGVEADAGLDSDAMQTELRQLIPQEHQEFLAGLRLSHVEGDYFFCHAGVRPGVPLDKQSPHDLMWIREDFLGSDIDYGKVVVHGHTPRPNPDIAPNRIGVDTGACYGGPLTAVVLEDDARRFLQV